ncbi:unnamed protein product, partial [Closterium sp. NIES-53]
EDLVSHLRTSDARYRAALPAEFLDRNPPPMYITLHFIVTRIPDSLRAVRDQFLALDPTDLTADLLEQHLLAAETSIVAIGAACGTPRTPFFERCSPSPLAPSYAFASAVDVLGAEDVGVASAISGMRRISKGKGGRSGGGGSGGGGKGGNPLPRTVPVMVTVGSGAARGAASGGAASGGAASRGAEPEGAELGGDESLGAEPGGVDHAGAEPEGAEPGGAEFEGAESGGAKPRGSASSGGPAVASPRVSPRPEPLSPQQLLEWFAQRTRLRSGAAGAGDSAIGGTGAGGTVLV